MLSFSCPSCSCLCQNFSVYIIRWRSFFGSSNYIWWYTSQWKWNAWSFSCYESQSGSQVREIRARGGLLSMWSFPRRSKPTVGIRLSGSLDTTRMLVLTWNSQDLSSCSEFCLQVVNKQLSCNTHTLWEYCFNILELIVFYRMHMFRASRAQLVSNP